MRERPIRKACLRGMRVHLQRFAPRQSLRIAPFGPRDHADIRCAGAIAAVLGFLDGDAVPSAAMRLARLRGVEAGPCCEELVGGGKSTWSGRGPHLLERSSSPFVVVWSPSSTKGFEGGNACDYNSFARGRGGSHVRDDRCLLAQNGAQDSPSGQRMQDKGSVRGQPGASGYAPGQQMQQKGSKAGGAPELPDTRPVTRT